LTGNATTKATASDSARLPQNRPSMRPAAIAPGTAMTIALSMTSMTTIDTVSAARAVRVASRSGRPPARSGRIVSP